MHSLAIILFPGLNTELETKREIERAGMKAEYVRWNEEPSKLKKFDAYVIGGGFSYEDRGRAGVIAALDPVMDEIKMQAASGKPVLGICNGAQILVESGLVPGAEGGRQAVALAHNKRIKDGKVLGTGYYNVWVRMKVSANPKGCVFTWNMHEGEILEAPIAHGEGRFTTQIEGLMLDLRDRGQMPFRYCSANGAIMSEFPDNPNGAEFNAAALCNPAGNVMAIMPHLERAPEASRKLFESLKAALDDKKGVSAIKRAKLAVKNTEAKPDEYTPPKKGLQMVVALNITDNEAQTHEMALARMGFPGIQLKRGTHIEIEYKGVDSKVTPAVEKEVKKLVQTGVLLNTNKETAMVLLGKKLYEYKPAKGTLAEVPYSRPDNKVVLITRERDDFVGMSKLATLQNRFKMPEVTAMRVGTMWSLAFPEKMNKKDRESAWKKILESRLFFNPHRQVAWEVE